MKREIPKMSFAVMVDFEIGDFVKFNNRIGNDEGIVIGYNIRPGSSITYVVTWSDKKDQNHFAIELVKK